MCFPVYDSCKINSCGGRHIVYVIMWHSDRQNVNLMQEPKNCSPSFYFLLIFIARLGQGRY